MSAKNSFEDFCSEFGYDMKKPKITSVSFIFSDGSEVIYSHGSDEKYTGNVPRFQGKNYKYTLTIRHAPTAGTYTSATFGSPSQDNAKKWLNHVFEQVKN